MYKLKNWIRSIKKIILLFFLISERLVEAISFVQLEFSLFPVLKLLFRLDSGDGDASAVIPLVFKKIVSTGVEVSIVLLIMPSDSIEVFSVSLFSVRKMEKL